MKRKKLTQMQRIARLEKLLADIYIKVQAYKMTMEKQDEQKKD